MKLPPELCGALLTVKPAFAASQGFAINPWLHRLEGRGPARHTCNYLNAIPGPRHEHCVGTLEIDRLRAVDDAPVYRCVGKVEGTVGEVDSLNARDARCMVTGGMDNAGSTDFFREVIGSRRYRDIVCLKDGPTRTGDAYVLGRRTGQR